MQRLETEIKSTTNDSAASVKDLGSITVENISKLDTPVYQIIQEAIFKRPNPIFHKDALCEYTKDNITYQFTLTNTVLRTVSESHPGETTFWVIDDDAASLGKGTFAGAVLPIKGKLLLENDCLLFKNSGSKVVKIQKFKGPFTKAHLTSEVAKAKQIPDLNVKTPIQDEEYSYIIMDRIPGKTFLDLFGTHFTQKNYSNKTGYINLLTRIDIFLQISYSIQRLHQKNIIHLDLKNKKNILVHLDEHNQLLQASIIDLGMSRLIKENEKVKDEFPKQNNGENESPSYSEKDDIAAILKAMNAVIFDPKADGMLKKEVQHITKEFKEFITQYYSNNEINLPNDNSINLETLIHQLEREKFRIRYQDKWVANVANKESVNNANKHALKAKSLLNKFCLDFTDSPYRIDPTGDNTENDVGDYLTKIILTQLDNIDDEITCLHEFISTLDIKEFKNFQYDNKNTLITLIKENIKNTYNSFARNTNKLLDLYEELKQLNDMINGTKTDKDSSTKTPLEKAISEIEFALDKNKKYGVTIDEIKKLDTIYCKFLNKNTDKYNRLIELSKPSNDHAELTELKKTLQQSIDNYSKLIARNTITSKFASLFDHHSRFFEIRKTDVSELKNIINAATQSTQLINDIKSRLKQVKTGFFKNSRLVNNVNLALSAYEEKQVGRNHTFTN